MHPRTSTPRVLRSTALLLALCVTAALRANDPTPTFGDISGGPIGVVGADPLAAGTSSISLRYELVEFETTSDADLLTFAAAGSDAHSTDTRTVIRLDVAHGVTPDLTIGFQLPWISNEDVRAGQPDGGGGFEVRDDGTPEGIGDLQIYGLYRVARQATQGVEVSIVAGMTLPTGSTDEENSAGAEIDIENQPGDGAVDLTLGAALSHEAGRLTLHASVLGTLTSEGDRDTELGNRFDWGIGAVVPFADGLAGTDLSFDLVFEIIGEMEGRLEVDGTKDDHSGGNAIFFQPGVRVGLDGVWSAFAAAGFPMLDDPNGDGQETDVRLLFGVSAGF